MATEKNQVKKNYADSLLSVVHEEINADVRERLLFLLYSNVVVSAHRYKYLEKRYGISARRWQNVCNRVQMPGIDMLSLIIRDRPEYATWLMFGKAVNMQQIDPTTEHGMDQTEEGRIDLSEEGWEDKYQRIQEAIYLKHLGKPIL